MRFYRLANKKLPVCLLKTKKIAMTPEKRLGFFLCHVISGLKESTAKIRTKLVLREI